MRVMISFLSVVLLCSIMVAQGTDNSKALLDKSREFGTAWAKNDLPMLERMLKSDYLHTDISGHVQNKSEWLAYVKTRAAKAERNDIAFADEKVRIYGRGDIGIVTSENDISPEGKPAQTTRIRVTQVWVKVPGQGWQRTAYQATVISK